jgi:hypothetical protein
MDPLTLATLGLGLAGGIGSSLLGGKGSTTNVSTPTAPPPAPPIQAPQGSQSTYATGGKQPSFLSAAAAAPNPSQTGSKSLLGT